MGLDYYLPGQNSPFNPQITTPEDVLGWQVGKWHVSHDKLLQYHLHLAAQSPRVSVDTIGYSYEDRPLIQLYITSEQNQSKLETLRNNHLQALSSTQEVADNPLVVNLGYSVHGNEPSGGNASLVVAYFLAATTDPAWLDMLEQTVVVLDPCLNPDGFHRFSTWVNMHKGTPMHADPQDREHREVWPGGRTNHYWFDLNRDWLPVQHPESQGRVKAFQNWKPNVLADFHEMGTNSTFFFQPGIPSRNNPITPENTFVLTRKLANYHASALDELGSLYFTEEAFDDFYFGKGSTYPDVQGGVGILFEQASSRGHLQASIHGNLAFPFTIRNQVATSLSTLRGAHALRDELLHHQQTFYQEASEMAGEDEVIGYLLGGTQDKIRISALADILTIHQIDHSLFQDGQQNWNCWVKVDQPQYRLITAMFEERTSFQDSLFYDVSSWNLAHAFNLELTEIKDGKLANSIQANSSNEVASAVSPMRGGSPYAISFDWRSYHAPRLLNLLQQKGIRLKVATEPFGNEEIHEFPRGTIIIPMANQVMNEGTLAAFVKEQATGLDVPFHLHQTGLTSGVSLGSRTFENIVQPKVAVVVGDGISGYDAGEAWYVLEQRFGLNITLLPVEQLGRVDLSAYNVLIMPDGRYRGGAPGTVKQWVEKGGTLIAFKYALNWLNAHDLGNFGFASPATKPHPHTYHEHGKVRGAQVIGGAICEVEIDLSHPLAFGLERPWIPVFKKGGTMLSPDPYSIQEPFKFSQTPLIAGFLSTQNQATLSGTTYLKVKPLGAGRIIGMSDNPNFRAFWYGTQRIFMNAVCLGQIVD
ncbi:M14 family zinc carboxypeptidase [Pontibacter sp. G13]|uniref:M14 family zinc carboxypeptidase n=1 Tax=Pontibacter sp. G13 TaxID=3074898 RepID=UPI00288BF4A5|nr:M14 family zinc carboxypeptidase [Pontibacter sp. G13]WNJ18865.1 M14 family zinc carboxypeptidase [Pontibacter sp. G13]